MSLNSFPDGSKASSFFAEGIIPEVPDTIYCVTDHGVQSNLSDQVQTQAIQAVIDLAASHGGGEIRFPAGHYRSGSLFFKQGTTLHLEKGALLQGSDDISDYQLLPTRIEGENVLYFAALVNADSMDRFSITGEGCIDGCGLRFWKSFWLRLKWKPDCLNMDEMRPRLVYISNSKQVLLSGVRFYNSPFWTCHLYRCREVEMRDLEIRITPKDVPAPSSDAIDLDNCSNVWIHHCRMDVNDDAIALKGGKGPNADTAPEDGPNERILIEDCAFGICHSALTCGSECVDNSNIVMQNCMLSGTDKLFYLKMRPDTPQISRNIRIEKIKGNCNKVFTANSWTQFRRSPDIHFSRGEKILFSELDLKCRKFFDVTPKPDEFSISEIHFRNSRIESQETKGEIMIPSGVTCDNVVINV